MKQDIQLDLARRAQCALRYFRQREHGGQQEAIAFVASWLRGCEASAYYWQANDFTDERILDLASRAVAFDVERNGPLPGTVRAAA